MRTLLLGVAGVVCLLAVQFCPAATIRLVPSGTPSTLCSYRVAARITGPQALTFSVTCNTLYAWADSPNPTYPYGNWNTAAHTIQDAIDAASPGDIILVTNGIYAAGGHAVAGIMTNRVALTKAVLVQSVNGPTATIIEGSIADGIRCAYVGTNAMLTGFTLTSGGTRLDGDQVSEQSGGGVWTEPSGVVSNCVIVGNTCGNGAGAGAYGGLLYGCSIVSNSARVIGGGVFGGVLYNSTLTGNAGWLHGGGANDSTLYNCTVAFNKAEEGGGVFHSDCYNCIIVSNRASYGAGGSEGTFRNCILSGNEGTAAGGGVSGGTLYNCLITANTARRGGGANGILYNCTVSGNAALDGGGVASSTLYNSIVYYNTCVESGPNYDSSVFSWSCSTPLPPGAANIEAAPGFVNLAASNYRLAYGSPGIDSGTNISALISNDLAGLPRPLDGKGGGVSVFDMGAYEFDLRTVVPSDWLLQYGLDPNDPGVLSKDPDHDSVTTFQEWVVQTNPTDAYSLFRVDRIQAGGSVSLRFQSRSDRLYSLYYSTNLTFQGSSAWALVTGQENIPGTGGWQSLHDANVDPLRFYKVGVDFPR